MAETVVSIVLAVAGAYFGAGVLFAVAFHIKGLAVVDEAAHGAGIGFRIIITPGCVLLWPVLLRRWMKIAAAAKTHQPTTND